MNNYAIKAFFETWIMALENRLDNEYHKSGYCGSFQDFCNQRMSEILDVIVPSVSLHSKEPDNTYDPVKEAFDDWYHNVFKFDHSSKKINMLQAWRAAQKIYKL